jgi:hypothetical protein
MAQRYAAPLARSSGTAVWALVPLGGGAGADTSRAVRTKGRRNSQHGETVVGPQWGRWPVAGVYTSTGGCSTKPSSSRPVL